MKPSHALITGGSAVLLLVLIAGPGRAQFGGIRKAAQKAADAARRTNEKVQQTIGGAEDKAATAQQPQTPGGRMGGGAAALRPLDASVKELLLGPVPGPEFLKQGVWVSDDGAHVAIAATRGSRRVMLVDGVEGPLFDDIGGQTLGNLVEFSPTGGTTPT